jgi:TetR/AcrR family transcriptional regulator, copper-responsive repressor
MARPRAFDETEVLDRAMDVFLRHGYEGANLTELTAAMGVTAPSIYAAFGNKRGLFEAVLDHYADCEKEHRDWILAAPTAREVAERLLLRAADQLPGMKGPAGSLLIQGGLSAGPENADVPRELARRRQASELSLRDRFEQFKSSGDLPRGADAAGLAGFVTAVLDGLAVKAAGGAQRGELRKVVEQAMRTWNDHASGSDSAVKTVGVGLRRAPETVSGGRGRPREFCKDDALRAAVELFWRKGYEGTSLTDLTEAMGITRPSLYATFGNKEQLFHRALDLYQKENLAYVREAFEAPKARGVVEAMLDGAIASQFSGRNPKGCLATLNSMQGSDEAQVIRNEVLRRAAAARELMVARFARARQEGDLPSSVDPEGLARLLESVMYGIVAQGAAGANEAELRSLAATYLATWPQ